jgi:hypothetical protein
MSQPYPSKRVQLESDDRLQVKGLVEEVNSRLQELAAFVSRVAEIPIAPDVPTKLGVVGRFEARDFSGSEARDFSGSGVIIVAAPTDPPTLGCLYYADGQYTHVDWPCDHIDLPGGATIDLGGVLGPSRENSR